jgi:hypothetical protein
LQNVTVTAILLNKKEKFTFTDTDGEFGIEELKPGTYKIIFEKDGYRKVVRDKVNIRTNEPIELNIEMEYLEYNLFPLTIPFFPGGLNKRRDAEGTQSRKGNAKTRRK